MLGLEVAVKADEEDDDRDGYESRAQRLSNVSKALVLVAVVVAVCDRGVETE